MDSKRPPYAPPPPPPSHTPIDHRPPPPYFSQPSYPPPPQPQAPPQHPYQGPHHPGQGLSLPPLQGSYAVHGAPPNPPSLPPFQHQPQHPHEQREGQDYHAYNQQNRSGHATPQHPVRTYSHDSSHQQRTPTTPAPPGPYPSAPAPDGSQPPPQHMDHGGHHSYPPTNGIPHGLPPPGPPHQYEPPQHHYANHTPVMENHPGYPPPPAQPMYGSQTYGPASVTYANVQKRKQMRATQACEQCRQRKQKCDEGNPCSFCKENSMTCNYRDTPPAKTDKNMERLIQYMESHTQALSDLKAKMDNFDQRLRRVEHAGIQPVTGAENDSMVVEAIKRKPEIDDHRTAPHKLMLLWPSIAALLKDTNVNIGHGYVMEAEDRGILRIHSRGEGIDEHDGTQPGGPGSPARSDESSDGTPASPPEGLWGTGMPQTPLSDIRRSDSYCWGGLKPDGSLDLDPTTVNTLYESYMRNMHIMHPFLDKPRLRKLFDHFMRRYSIAPSVRSKFAVGSDYDIERPLKRQRSNGPSLTGMSGQDNNHTRKEPTERSPGNAIVWLVLALGKICMHSDPLPPPVPDGRPNTNTVISHQLTGNPGMAGSSPISAAMKPSPMSPKSTPTTQPTPSSMDGGIRRESRSRRNSNDGFHVASLRNLDVIPGLAYYAKAAEILGDQGDGNDLVHAQMFLLAGLYKGQLARVRESMSWLSMAGRAIINLLDRYKLYNEHYWISHGDIRKQHETGQARIKDKRHSLIVLASWTCLQLESDILAELRLPNSGIQGMEHMLLWPRDVPDSEAENYDGLEASSEREGDANILLLYTAQMWLRKRLNQVHQEMYGNQCLSQTLPQVREMLSGHENMLGSWRETLPPSLQWHDDDRPAADILEARLRAKYWGARYVINRPFLDYALHLMAHVKEGHHIESVAQDVHGNPRSPAEIHLFKAIEGMGEQQIWEASKRCIEAAMQSTVAFDNVPDRLIITNIHGTAHAQFGNMLVLSATYYHSWLKPLIPLDRFKYALKRTIRFLRRLAPISPTCAIDCSMLEKIEHVLFDVPPDAKHVYRNEGIAEPPSATTSFSAGT